MSYSNVILTDIDGVVLNWEYAFNVWMAEHGHFVEERENPVYDISKAYGIDRAIGKRMVRMFNESAHIGFLPPLRDSMYYMKKLHEEHGFVFHAITSLSNNQNAQKLRIMNLQKLFGETLFEKFIILGCGDDKDEALEPYRNSGLLWVEDKIDNAQTGKSLGLDSVLMAHGHNRDEYNIPRVQNWKGIYEKLVG